ncbi:MAG TPA: gamma carbonic anhydrase family protein, partial [Alcanivorax sp.]|nr:gamma carbonic anhydrase family protein [Alcanivorax sp.]HAI24434.1 gamma carbonic anhydrase family protein [Alcanivorax sp.]HBY50681.1 gamma carbonic anhydrase family protein [Alcanivorax sp.]
MGYIDPQARTDQAAYIHESAWLYGDIELAEGASVWINAALRAELYDIRIGRYTNLQDFVMVHIGNHTGTRIGDYCSITHHVTLHGCTIGDNCLVGINSTIMDGCVIGDNCIIAGHTFLKEGTEIPD